MNMDATHEEGLIREGESPIFSITTTATTAASEAMVMVRRLTSSPPDGRAILTVLYVCVLSLCFAVPLLYYCRMHWEERQARRLRDLELAGITQAMAQSQNQHRHESRAARRKFREERKARIRQLFGSVKMVLTTDNFPHLREAAPRGESNHLIIQGGECTTTGDVNDPDSKQEESNDIETGVKPPMTSSNTTREPSTRSSVSNGEAVEEDQLGVEIPTPGFQFASKAPVLGHLKKRQVPNLCSICLSNYYPGETIVWSSNEACDHAFHEQCIFQWLMKQREGPLCPCCRRDFVIDPYDMEDEDPNLIFIATLEDEDQEELEDIRPQRHLQQQQQERGQRPLSPTVNDSIMSLDADAGATDGINPEMAADEEVGQGAALSLHMEAAV